MVGHATGLDFFYRAMIPFVDGAGLGEMDGLECLERGLSAENSVKPSMVRAGERV